MLNVCTGNGNHDEIVHQGHICPLCNAIAEKDRAEDDAENLAAERDKLLAQLEETLK